MGSAWNVCAKRNFTEKRDASLFFLLLYSDLRKKQQENSSRGDGRFGGFIGGDEDFDDDGECFSDFFTKALGHNLTNCPI